MAKFEFELKVLGYILALILLATFIENSHSETITYCNKLGSTTTCQVFKGDGSEDIQYFNQSGDTITEQEFQVQDPTNQDEEN